MNTLKTDVRLMYNGNSVEKIRIFATFLLVIFHVVGVSHGPELTYPSEIRTFLDVLADFRMPAFAMISGFVYALRPVQIPDFGAFIAKKLQRLAVPGLVAMLIYSVISLGIGQSWALPLAEIWRHAIYPYYHFWYLQALLAILFAVGLIDAGTKGRGEYLLPFAIILSIANPPTTAVFSLDRAIHLTPFFMVGIVFWRHKAWIEQHARALIALAVLTVAVWFIWTVAGYRATGVIATDHRQSQALMFGISTFVLLLFYPIPLPASREVGGYTFTIYLYHLLAAAGMRKLLLWAGIHSLAVHAIFGIAAALLLPAALHRLLRDRPLGAQLILGIRRSPKDRSKLPSGTRSANPGEAEDRTAIGSTV